MATSRLDSPGPAPFPLGLTRNIVGFRGLASSLQTLALGAGSSATSTCLPEGPENRSRGRVSQVRHDETEDLARAGKAL